MTRSVLPWYTNLLAMVANHNTTVLWFYFCRPGEPGSKLQEARGSSSEQEAHRAAQAWGHNFTQSVPTKLHKSPLGAGEVKNKTRKPKLMWSNEIVQIVSYLKVAKVNWEEAHNICISISLNCSPNVSVLSKTVKFVHWLVRWCLYKQWHGKAISVHLCCFFIPLAYGCFILGNRQMNPFCTTNSSVC